MVEINMNEEPTQVCRIRVSDSWQEESKDRMTQTLKAIEKKYDDICFPNGVARNRDYTTAQYLLHELQLRYAYLHGGFDRGESPVLCFPHYPDLVEVKEEDFNRIVQYLCCLTNASSADLGFVALIDRRMDRYSSVKFIIQRLEKHFPGYLKQILVLRPAGFIRGTFSDLSFRWQKEDFSMKVEMLSSVEELYKFVDPSQLTADFTGMYSYNY